MINRINVLETVGESYILHVNIADHPDSGKFAHELDDILIDAAEEYIAGLRRRDLLVDIMLNPSYQLWDWVHIPIKDLRVGYLMHCTGPTPDGQFVSEETWAIRTTSGSLSKRGYMDNGTVLAPVPLDATTLASNFVWNHLD